MSRLLEQLFPSSLSSDEQSKLNAYHGVKRALFKDGKLVENSDTRELPLEKLRKKQKLKMNTRNKILESFPLHKQLNFAELPADEQAMYSAKKKDLLEKYEQRKQQLEACAGLDELDKVNLIL